MRDVDEGKETKNAKVEQSDTKKVESGMKGWTAKDGTVAHSIYQDAVYDELDDLDSGVEVYNNEEITLPDGRRGIIDTRVNNSIIDYKTHDMSNWSLADATRFGNKHGEQVKGYVESKYTPSDSKGYIFAVGKPSENPQVLETYANTLASHGIGIKFTPDARPQDIVNAANDIYQETG